MIHNAEIPVIVVKHPRPEELQLYGTHTKEELLRKAAVNEEILKKSKKQGESAEHSSAIGTKSEIERFKPLKEETLNEQDELTHRLSNLSTQFQEKYTEQKGKKVPALSATKLSTTAKLEE